MSEGRPIARGNLRCERCSDRVYVRITDLDEKGRQFTRAILCHRHSLAHDMAGRPCVNACAPYPDPLRPILASARLWRVRQQEENGYEQA